MTQGFAFVNRGDAGCTVEPSMPCAMCMGRGDVTAEQAERYRVGRLFQRARIDLELSLRDLVTNWGGSPSMWSAAELYGIGDPWLFDRMAAWIEHEGDPPEATVQEPVQ